MCRQQSVPSGTVIEDRGRGGDGSRDAPADTLVKMLQARISEERVLREAAEKKLLEEHVQVDVLRGEAAKHERPGPRQTTELVIVFRIEIYIYNVNGQTKVFVHRNHFLFSGMKSFANEHGARSWTTKTNSLPR